MAQSSSLRRGPFLDGDEKAGIGQWVRAVSLSAVGQAIGGERVPTVKDAANGESG